MVFLEVLSVANCVFECLVDMMNTSPGAAMARIFVIDPILTRVEQYVAFHAVGVSAHVRSEVMEDMVTGTMLVSAGCDERHPYRHNLSLVYSFEHRKKQYGHSKYLSSPISGGEGTSTASLSVPLAVGA